MEKLIINGSRPLNGTVKASGAKNAAVAILPATLLVAGVCRVENVPDISDVRILLDILADMGVVVEKPEPGVVELDSTTLTSLDDEGSLIHAKLCCRELIESILNKLQ